ncbi:hypothetical protein JOD14_002369 [Enterococcus lemanii]|nr:hypothetical protein [Enterococcus lemanii]
MYYQGLNRFFSITSVATYPIALQKDIARNFQILAKSLL